MLISVLGYAIGGQKTRTEKEVDENEAGLIPASYQETLSF